MLKKSKLINSWFLTWLLIRRFSDIASTIHLYLQEKLWRRVWPWNFYWYETLELSFKCSLFQMAAASVIFQAWRIIANGNVDEHRLKIFVSFQHCWNSFWPALKIPIVVAVVCLLTLLRLFRLPSVYSLSGLCHYTLVIESLQHFRVTGGFSERSKDNP